ncbi:hypothetical protein MKY42_07715 [Paenibacillus sp. FSL W7-1088]
MDIDFAYLAMTRDKIPFACCPEREGIGETFFSERTGITPLQP